MVKKFIWLIVSCLMVLSLVMASCGPATEEEEEEGEGAITETEEPQYGGVLNLIQPNEPGGFDPRVTMIHFTRTLPVTHDFLLTGDWAKGPAGTGETSWQIGFLGRTELFAGELAESWELQGNDTLIFHVRKGVKWQNKSPMYDSLGEVTAEDVVWNIEKDWTTPGMNLDIFFKKEDHPTSFKALDKYTVEIKFPPHAMAQNVMETACRIPFLPPEITEKYGDQSDWKNSTGTGPYMLEDYTVGSSITYKKNPDYWGIDPVGPGKGNKLPYMDGVVELIIPDASTQLAALRTGKVDCTRGITVSWENGEQLLQQNPKMKHLETPAMTMVPCGRVDKPELPFHDLRVRQALNLAVNQQEILDGYYKGHGYLIGYPFFPVKEHAPFYTPPEQLPDKPISPDGAVGAKELFTYNPDKAKELLAEAGYPNGFKTEIVCNAPDADFLAMIREYFLKVGVDMEIKPMEASVFNSLTRARTHEQMIFSATHLWWGPWLMHEVRVDSSGDLSMWEDPKTLEVYDLINRNLGMNDKKWTDALKAVTPFILEESWGVWMPASFNYIMWWPWLKNYHGEIHVGYVQWYEFTRYSWLDTELKKSMGY